MTGVVESELSLVRLMTIVSVTAGVLVGVKVMNEVWRWRRGGSGLFLVEGLCWCMCRVALAPFVT